MAAQCAEFRPPLVVMAEPDAALELQQILTARGISGVQVEGGDQALTALAADPGSDVVMAAIVGAVGLLPTLAAANAGKRVLLANKEALVMSGALLMREVSHSGGELLPIDSEHNAVFQCLPEGFRAGLAHAGVERIMLTASGGPFRECPARELVSVTAEQACAHPNWRMGRKISVDSATLMNKGLELIEACWLFDAKPTQVQVVLHPQSVVHSLVAYCDGSVLAQLGNPDMRTPIAHALAWPERIDAGVEPLDLPTLARLDFGEPDRTRFPCLGLAEQAAAVGGIAPVVLNAANEVAVEAFLAGRIAFTEIPQVVDDALAHITDGHVEDLQAVLAVDRAARARATSVVSRITGGSAR
jgi:1-deoxy-D-xylulose-5-phosphate reductoisomerase